jgi:hypothetical protein
MDNQPVIELSEAQLDEYFGGTTGVGCNTTAVDPCSVCIGD